MKILLVCLLFILNYTFASTNIKLNLEPTPLLLENILIPLWENIPYRYEIPGNKSFKLEESISIELQKSTFILGPKTYPLFKLDLENNNRINLIWDLSMFNANAIAKVRFKFKQFGVQITHDEYFEIKASSIGHSVSKLKLNFSNPEIRIKLLENIGFEIQSADIKPKDGIGQILRYIFDNIYSKEEVRNYITQSLNIELKKWINSHTLLNSVETTINENLKKTQDKIIKLSDLANHFKINFNQINTDAQRVLLELTPQFIYKDLTTHPCAKNLVSIDNKSTISFSNSLLETMVNNYNTYEIWEDDKRIEPFFCLGYKEFDEQDNPIGETATARFLGRNIDFKYWVRPDSKPMYEYIYSENIIKIYLNLHIDIKDENYPIVKATNNRLKAKLVGFFKLEFLKDEGLNLIIQELQMPSITGNLRVKWNKFTPSIKLPLNLVRSSLEKYINSVNQMKSINILKSEIQLNKDITFELLNYQMQEQDQTISFQTK